MRKIERRIKSAWDLGVPCRIDNTQVRVDSINVDLYLFGKHIATRRRNTADSTWFSMAGYGTSTTRSRLNNVVTVGIRQQNHVQLWGDRAIITGSWYNLTTGECKDAYTFRLHHNLGPAPEVVPAPVARQQSMFEE